MRISWTHAEEMLENMNYFKICIISTILPSLSLIFIYISGSKLSLLFPTEFKAQEKLPPQLTEFPADWPSASPALCGLGSITPCSAPCTLLPPPPPTPHTDTHFYLQLFSRI